MHIALIPAAGTGQRFNFNHTDLLPKQYTELNKKTMLVHTVQALLDFPDFFQIWVIVSPTDSYAKHCLSDLLIQYPNQLKLSFVGGNTRAETVNNGLKALIQHGVSEQAWIWVHDAARPAIGLDQLNALKQALFRTAVGAILAVPVTDTLKYGVIQPDDISSNHQVKNLIPSLHLTPKLTPKTDKQSTIDRINTNINTYKNTHIPTNNTIGIDSIYSNIHTISREHVWQAQTPQCFGLKALSDALDTAQANSIAITDEASAMEYVGYSPILVLGHRYNFKVTHFEDAALMKAILCIHKPLNTLQLKMAVGEGMDVHALVPGRPLILGGVTIPHNKGLQGHSDADALLHAITDALLGAAGMGDIGRLFPDTDMHYYGANSQNLLSQAYQQVSKAGWRVNNVDATIVAQTPKMAPYIAEMQTNIAHCLNIQSSQVNIKAKTNEKLGWLGREEGIETRASILLLTK